MAGRGVEQIWLEFLEKKVPYAANSSTSSTVMEVVNGTSLCLFNVTNGEVTRNDGLYKICEILDDQRDWGSVPVIYDY